jgi:hypothetical protein
MKPLAFIGWIAGLIALTGVISNPRCTHNGGKLEMLG